MSINRNIEYTSRINIVCDYIERNLSRQFTLDELSDVSGFSKYHFHRIFSCLMNETLYNYITRLKLERAVGELIMPGHKSVTDIALDLGFADSAMFARAFKKHYGISATQYRKIFRKMSKEMGRHPGYNHVRMIKKRSVENMEAKYDVTVKNIDKMNVAYLRHIGTYQELGTVFKPMIGRLMQWAQQSGAINESTKLLAVYHDNPNITDEDKLKTSICVSIGEHIKTRDDIGKMEIAGGKYAIGHFEIDDAEAALQHTQAWEYMYGVWLPQSGYVPDDLPVFEVYVNNPETHPQRKHIVDIYLPVKNM